MRNRLSASAVRQAHRNAGGMRKLRRAHGDRHHAARALEAVPELQLSCQGRGGEEEGGKGCGEENREEARRQEEGGAQEGRSQENNCQEGICQENRFRQGREERRISEKRPFWGASFLRPVGSERRRRCAERVGGSYAHAALAHIPFSLPEIKKE